MSQSNFVHISMGSDDLISSSSAESHNELPLFIDVNSMPAAADLPLGSNTGSSNVSIVFTAPPLYFL